MTSDMFSQMRHPVTAGEDQSFRRRAAMVVGGFNFSVNLSFGLEGRVTTAVFLGGRNHLIETLERVLT